MTEYTYTKKDLDEMDEHYRKMFMILLDRVEPRDKYQLEAMYDIAIDLEIDPKEIRLENWSYEMLNHAIDHFEGTNLSRHLQYVTFERDQQNQSAIYSFGEWEYCTQGRYEKGL